MYILRVVRQRFKSELCKLAACSANRYLHFLVPLNGGVPLSSAYHEIESNREGLGIEDYSLSQTTLDHIFCEFAATQDSECTTRARYVPCVPCVLSQRGVKRAVRGILFFGVQPMSMSITHVLGIPCMRQTFACGQALPTTITRRRRRSSAWVTGR
jgi:hypothetical protein